MGTLKMDYYLNIKPTSSSKYADKNNVISVGFRKGTFYVGGNVSKVLSQNDIEVIYIIKDQTYQPVSVDTFLALVRGKR